MTRKTEESPNKARRDFLKLAGTSAPLAAVAVATAGSTAEAADPDLTRETMQDPAHTRAYYDSARL